MTLLHRIARLLKGRAVSRAADRHAAAADKLDAALRELLRQ